jgi:hypothetical protein
MSMTTSAAEILDTLNECETALPVDRWRVGGMRVWPLIRVQLGMDLFARAHVQGEPVPRTAGSPALAFVRSQLGALANKAAWPRADALFLSDGVSFVQIESGRYERFCDPMRAHLSGDGRASVLLVPGAQQPSEAHGQVWIQPALDRIRLRNRLRRAVRRRLPEDLEGFDQLGALLRRRASASLMDVERIRREAGLVLDYASHFRCILDRTRPRACFVVSYYWLLGYGLILACRRAGIPVADIQHGVQGEMHHAYARWARVPAEGYEVLPDVFWCWSEAECEVIRRWAIPAGGAHVPVHGGNLFLEMWRAGEPSAAGSNDALNAALTGKGGWSMVVLVTLQPGLAGPALLRLLHEAARSTGSALWLVRLHPAMREARPMVKQVLGGLENVEIDLASDLPLYALLPRTGVHVTHSSSTVLEAGAFGINSVLLSDYGVELFAAECERGVAVRATNAAELIAALERQFRARATPEAVQAEGRRALAAGYRLVDAFLERGRKVALP